MNTLISQSEWSFSDIIKSFSADTWNRIGFSHQTGLKINEVTITQNLVYHLYMLATTRQFPIKIFESRDEKTNGNDLEILVEAKEGIIKLPCQAKIIGSNGRYKKLNHWVNDEPQIDLLLRYAKKTGGYPIYLFYNYDSKGDAYRLGLIGESKEFWGCTTGSADKIKTKFFNSPKFRSPKFYDMHEGICKPFHLLAEAAIAKNVGNELKRLFTDIDFGKLKKYSLEQIQDDYSYVDITPAPSLGYLPTEELQTEFLRPEAADRQKAQFFKPKFRILFSKENLNVSKLAYLD